MPVREGVDPDRDDPQVGFGGDQIAELALGEVPGGGVVDAEPVAQHGGEADVPLAVGAEQMAYQGEHTGAGLDGEHLQQVRGHPNYLRAIEKGGPFALG